MFKIQSLYFSGDFTFILYSLQRRGHQQRDACKEHIFCSQVNSTNNTDHQGAQNS